jgi:hypothetical protein
MVPWCQIMNMSGKSCLCEAVYSAMVPNHEDVRKSSYVPCHAHVRKSSYVPCAAVPKKNLQKKNMISCQSMVPVYGTQILPL